MMDRVWSFDAPWDLLAMSKFGTITSLAESPLDENLLYAGTDDGLIQISEDGGASWRRIDGLPGVPPGSFVNDIKADLHDVDTVYLVIDDHKSGDFTPLILRSKDRGRSWRSMAGDLPARHLVWRLVQDHVNPDLFFAGTEFGVFFTVDGGDHWVKLKGGVPTISFRDLAIQRRENDLVGATFGRGFYILDDYSLLRTISTEALQQEATLFPVRQTRWYIPRRPIGRNSDKASQGEALYVAPNPDFGAVFTYYLNDELKTRQGQRRDMEKPVEAAGGDTPYPGWDAVREEAFEAPPAIVLTVRDAEGDIVRHVDGPTSAGFHRVAWDLRFPPVTPWQSPDAEPLRSAPKGALAPPGSYTVTLAKRINGELLELSQPETVEVISIREPVLAGSSPAEMSQFSLRVHNLKRSVDGSVSAIDEVLQQLDALNETLLRSTADPDLNRRAHQLTRQARELRERLGGWEEREQMGDPGAVSIKQRIDVATSTNSAYGPTPTHQRSIEIAEQQLAEVSTALTQLIDVDLRQLRDDLNNAGVPWSPGRLPGSL